ncbi:MAG: RnfABCDGE type electron transport complex subunit B [Eubacteriales bacterium]|nr:RnfABCDGE type electron transport complex subunit B [Eubacteriales bacterium]
MNGIVLAALTVGGTGIVIGILLGIAGKIFHVDVDPKETEIREVLPGNNCGGCGYPGCDGLAAAIAAGEAPANGCPVGGVPVALKIGAIMGTAIDDTKKMVAYVHCGGDCEKSKIQYEYTGVEDCAMMAYVPNGGSKICNNGCVGYGNCKRACPFDAIEIVNGVAVVQKEKCRACKKCMAACPKELISLVPYDAVSHTACSCTDKGKVVIVQCDAGCISCMKCQKNCPSGAMKVINNVPTIEYDICINCGKCKEVCPRKSIV